MVLRSLFRFGKLASQLNCRASHHIKSLSLLPYQAKMLSFRPKRFFSFYHSDTIESLKIKITELENKQEDNSSSLIKLYDKITKVFTSMHDPIQAATYIEKTIKIIENQKEWDLDNLRNRFISLGYMYLQIKDSEKAIKNFEKSLKLAKEMQGDNSKEIAIALTNLSMTHILNNNNEKTNEYLDLAWPYMQQHINNNDRKVGLYLLLRGLKFISKNKANEAIDLLNKSRKIFEQWCGPKSIGVAEIDLIMAITYMNLKMVNESKDAFERVIRVKQTLRLFDENLIEHYRFLGYQYKQMNNINKFKEIIEAGAEAFKKIKGDNKKLLAIYYNFLGGDFKYFGDIKTFKELLQKSLEIFKTLKIENTKEMAMCFQNFSMYAHDCDENDKAIEYAQKVLEIKIALGLSPEEIFNSIVSIGKLYNFKGNLIEAEHSLMKAKKLLEESKVKDGNAWDHLMTEIALLYKKQGKYAEALTNFQKLAEIKRRAYGEIHETFGEVYFNIGELYEKLNKIQEAIEEYKKAVDMNIKTYGRYHPNTYMYIRQLGTSYRTAGKIQEALAAHNDALGIGLNLFGENDPKIGAIYSQLALDFRDLQYWDKSIQFHNKTINIYKQCYDSNHDFEQLYWFELYRLGETYEKKGDNVNALQNYKKVKDFYFDTYGENHKFIPEIQIGIDRITAASNNIFMKNNNLCEELEALNEIKV